MREWLFQKRRNHSKGTYGWHHLNLNYRRTKCPMAILVEGHAVEAQVQSWADSLGSFVMCFHEGGTAFERP